MNLPFLDTNVLLYAALQPDRRSDTARTVLRAGGVVSVQVLNEFANVARRKLGRPWAEIRQALAAIRTLCRPPLPLTAATHEHALTLAGQTGYSFYDALIIASALDAGCDALLTEDMHDGQLIAGRLRIRNPFAAG